MAGTAAGQYDHMVHNYFIDKVQSLEGRRREALAAAAASPASADQYVAGVSEPVAQAFSTLPAERCPLRASVTHIICGAEYDIECVHFDSRPGLVVTANLYMPAAARAGEKVPGVIFSCGHSAEGKAGDKYQEACGRQGTSQRRTAPSCTFGGRERFGSPYGRYPNSFK